MCSPLLCLCRPFCSFERCLDSNPESCHSKQARYKFSLMSPRIHCCCLGYTFVVLDIRYLLMSPSIHLCRPRYTYVALDTVLRSWISLCHPGYNFVALDKLMLPWIQNISLDTLLSPWILSCRHGYTVMRKNLEYKYVFINLSAATNEAK